MGVLPVSKKEGKRKRKNGIGPKMNYDVIAVQFCREAKWKKSKHTTKREVTVVSDVYFGVLMIIIEEY